LTAFSGGNSLLGLENRRAVSGLAGTTLTTISPAPALRLLATGASQAEAWYHATVQARELGMLAPAREE
jgi:hypothetical protein